MESIFVPVYNEADRITSTIKKLKTILSGREYELTVVDDASTDDTAKICTKLAEKGKINYVRFDNGPTRRENLAKAMGECQSECIAFTDCDLAADVEILPTMLDELAEYDLVIASRNLKDSKISRKKWRNAFNLIANHLIRKLFQSTITDHQCGLKAFRGNVLRKISSDMGYDKTLCRSWGWDAEILIRAQKSKYAIKEVPCRWSESEKSSVSVFRDWKMAPYFMSLRKRKF